MNNGEIMHIIMAVEGYADETGIAKWEKDWHGREYANGKAKLRVRKVELYTLAINEIGREEFLSELKGLAGDLNGAGGNNSDGAFRWDRAANYARMVGGVFGIKKIDDTNIVAKPVGVQAGKSGWNCHYVVIGEVTDHKDKHGTEQV